MKKWIVVVFCLLFAGRVWAIDINGYLKTDWRLKIDGAGAFNYNENDLGLRLKSAVGSGASVFADLELKNIGIARSTTLRELALYDKTEVAPWTLELKEAYLDLAGIFVKGLDMRIGKQRTAWGTADRFNPTDNLNPLDLSDVTDFGKRLGSNSVKATYYTGDCYLQGVFVPLFTPAVLPVNYQSLYNMPAGVTDTIVLPENKIANSMFGVKAGGKIFGFDSSISYFYGYDALPLAKKTTFDCSGTLPPFYLTSGVGVELEYPKIQVIGLDVAGSISDVGVWAELAYFMPEKFDTETIANHGSYGPQTSSGTALENPYFKYTVGADYTFPFEIYANVQYCHGFFDERGTSANPTMKLRDYLIAEADKKFFDDKLKIALAGFFEMNFSGGDRFFPSYTVYPEISYYPFEATEIVLGAYLIESWPEGKFYSSKDSDEMFLKVKYSF